MTVKHSLLSILAQQDCYGYQLRAEYERRTARAWPLNVGQIYNTLERLERDGQVTRRDTDDQGHVHWAITPAGRAEVQSWFSSPSSISPSRDDRASKVAMAISLPGVDAAAVIAQELAVVDEQLVSLNAQQLQDPHPQSRLIRSVAIAHAVADQRWLSDAAAGLDSGELANESAVVLDRPKRGRPRKSAA